MVGLPFSISVPPSSATSFAVLRMTVRRLRLPSFSRPLSRGIDQIAHRFPLHPIMAADFDIIDVLAPLRGFRNHVCRQIFAHRRRRLVFLRVVGLAKRDLSFS